MAPIIPFDGAAAKTLENEQAINEIIDLLSDKIAAAIAHGAAAALVDRLSTLGDSLSIAPPEPDGWEPISYQAPEPGPVPEFFDAAQDAGQDTPAEKTAEPAATAAVAVDTPAAPETAPEIAPVPSATEQNETAPAAIEAPDGAENQAPDPAPAAAAIDAPAVDLDTEAPAPALPIPDPAQCETLATACNSLQQLKTWKNYTPTFKQLGITSKFDGAYDSTMVLTALSNSMRIEAYAVAEGNFTFNGVVDAKNFFNAVNGYKKQNITVSRIENALVLSNIDNQQIELNLQARADAHDAWLMDDEIENTLEIPANVLHEALKTGGIGVSYDTTKPALNCVLIHLFESKIRVASTDGFTLAYANFDHETGVNDVKITLDRKEVDILVRLLAKQKDAMVSLSYGLKTARFSWQGVNVTIKRAIVNYPLYEKILPAPMPCAVEFDKEEFTRVIKIMALKCDDYNKNVRFFLYDQEGSYCGATILVQHPDEGINRWKGGCTSAGQDFGKIELAFNINYLKEILAKAKGDVIRYEFKDGMSQGIFSSPNKKSLVESGSILIPIAIPAEKPKTEKFYVRDAAGGPNNVYGEGGEIYSSIYDNGEHFTTSEKVAQRWLETANKNMPSRYIHEDDGITIRRHDNGDAMEVARKWEIVRFTD